MKTPIPKYYVRSKKYAETYRIQWRKRIKNLKLLRQKKLKICKIQWYYDYGASIASNNQVFIFSKKYNDEVPIGTFMRWWESDFKQFGIYEKDWNKLTIWEKRIFESKLQAKNWAKLEYKSHWLETYHPKEYDKIWWIEREKLPKEARHSTVHPLFRRLINKSFNRVYK